MEIESNVDQYLGIETDIPAYLSQGDVTVTYDSISFIYSISGWPTDMFISDTWVLYLPSAHTAGSNFTLDASLKYPDTTFSTVYHLFYEAIRVTVAASSSAINGATLSISSPTGDIKPGTTSDY